MVEGILVVNLDPPYIGFVSKNSAKSPKSPSESKRLKGSLKSCSSEELRQMLIELGAITQQQHWPPKDCTMRVPGSYPSALLEKMGLAMEAGSGS